MGFLDSILAPFGFGDPLGKAADARVAGINTGLAGLNTQYGAGRGALTDQYGIGSNYLNDYYTRALAPYGTIGPQATAGYGAYADASGAGGAPGFQRAFDIFKASPDMRAGIDEGVDAMRRAGALTGDTGNTASAAGKFAMQQMINNYGNYVSRLAPWLQEGGRVAGAQSDLASKFGFGQAQGAMDLGKLLSGSYFDQGKSAFDAAAKVGEARAGGELAPLLYGNNIWEGIGQAAKFGSGMGWLPGGVGTNLSGGMGLPRPGSQQTGRLY